MSNKKILVDYTARDFDRIKSQLEEHARVHYPDSYKDFSENSFGSYLTDAVAYVGDMLSFYLDFQVNESFLDTALEYNNVRKLANKYGIKSYGRPVAYGMATFYIRVPAATGGGPDRNYLPILKRGTEVKSSNGSTFVLIEDVHFKYDRNEVVPSRFDSTTGNPTEYAVRARGQVKSAILYQNSVPVGRFTRFKKIRIGPASISQIVSVIDSEGHEYYEVECLSQDVVYLKTRNTGLDTNSVPEIIKPKVVPRRYVVYQDATGTYLQFGQGSDEENLVNDFTDPSQSVLDMVGKNYISDTSFDPKELLKTNTLGVCPSNTTINVVFEMNSADSINVSAGSLNKIVRTLMEFDSGLVQSRASNVRSSLEVSNDTPIVGNTSLPTSEEIRHRAYASNASQYRAVTRNDYEAFIYKMPANLGSIKRASVVNDPSSSNRRLSVYVISEDGFGNLTIPSQALKENLKEWLNMNKMLNDNIDIYDAKIINIGFDYEIIVHPSRDKLSVLNDVQLKLEKYMQEKMYIGEYFSITNIYNLINKVPGVVDTISVKPLLKTGVGYQSHPISIEEMKSNDGMSLKCPRNCIYEIRNFSSDIKGAAV